MTDGNYYMFLRPHQISLSEGVDWKVMQVQLIGKETMYYIKCMDHYLWVEIKGDPKYKVGNKVAINITENLHYLKR
jgi:ABC-type sugar transport system ATPase subunit